MRRRLKISLWIAGGLALLLLLLGGSLYIAGNTDSGRSMIERLTRRLTSGHVSLTGLKGSFPQEMTLAHLELSDDRGVFGVGLSVAAVAARGVIDGAPGDVEQPLFGGDKQGGLHGSFLEEMAEM